MKGQHQPKRHVKESHVTETLCLVNRRPLAPGPPGEDQAVRELRWQDQLGRPRLPAQPPSMVPGTASAGNRRCRAGLR